MQTNAVAYPADVPRGRKAHREELSVAETIVGWRGSLPGGCRTLNEVETLGGLPFRFGKGRPFFAFSFRKFSPEDVALGVTATSSAAPWSRHGMHYRSQARSP